MEEEKKHIDELIATYLTEGLDKNALAELKAWIAASPENKNYFIQQREVWFSAVSREAASKYNKDKAFDTFKKRIGNRKEIEKTSHHGFRLSMLWRYAAIIAVILAVGCFSYWQGGVNVKDTFADISVEAPLGSRTKLYLPDGTLVWLNAGSKLKYPVRFNGSQRRVFLSGEAYFAVERDTAHPFIVSGSSGEIRVLGTEFNIRDYEDEERVVTTLVKGAVSYTGKNLKQGEIVMKPGEQVRAGRRGEKPELLQVNPKEFISWKDGIYFFNKESLEEMMKTVGRNYDVEVFFNGEALKKLRFSGQLKKYERVEEFLQFIETGGDVTFIVKDRTITVNPK